MIRASEIAAFLSEPLQGPDVVVASARPLSEPLPNSLLFVKKFRPAWVSVLNASRDILVLAPPEYADHLRVSHILTAHPRLALARVLQRYFAPRQLSGVASTAVVHPTARLGEGVAIGQYTVIGSGVEIGAHTVIRNHVVVAEGTRIGCRCLVKSHAVIGEEGFGMEFDDDHRPLRVPHLGRVVLGDDVEVGALCTIARGTLGETILEDFVKLDDHVHIAHNVIVGANTLVTACAEVSGSVRIGRNVWVGPNATVNNDLSLADNCLVGAGAVVLKASRSGESLLGNPARPLWKE